jgi:hypothetical protein
MAFEAREAILELLYALVDGAPAFAPLARTAFHVAAEPLELALDRLDLLVLIAELLGEAPILCDQVGTRGTAEQAGGAEDDRETDGRTHAT